MVVAKHPIAAIRGLVRPTGKQLFANLDRTIECINRVSVLFRSRLSHPEYVERDDGLRGKFGVAPVVLERVELARERLPGVLDRSIRRLRR